MPVAAQVLAGIAAAIHVLFFYLESIAFTRKPAVARTFGSTSPEETQVLKGIFLNQGFYNLFLAIGVIVGLVLYTGNPAGSRLVLMADHSSDANQQGLGIMVFGLACMLGAAVVLIASAGRQMLRGALIQGLAPLAALLAIAFA